MAGYEISQRFSRQISSLEEVFDLSSRFAESASLKREAEFDVDFILEEIFTNMVKYNPDGKGKIEVALQRTDSSVVLRLADFDSDYFDISEAPTPDVEAPLEERRPGGLGIYLVKQLASKVEYDYQDRTSTVTITIALN